MTPLFTIGYERASSRSPRPWRLAREAEARWTCLLCFEADPCCCHRQVLAERLVDRAPRAVHELIAAPAQAPGAPR